MLAISKGSLLKQVGQPFKFLASKSTKRKSGTKTFLKDLSNEGFESPVRATLLSFLLLGIHLRLQFSIAVESLQLSLVKMINVIVCFFKISPLIVCSKLSESNTYISLGYNGFKLSVFVFIKRSS